MSHEPRRRIRKRPDPQRAALRWSLAIILLAAASAPTASAAGSAGKLPYIPTTILAPPALTGQGKRESASTPLAAYAFREKNGRVEFSSLDIGATIDGKKGWKTLSSELPFLKDVSDTTTFSPTLTESGSVVVYVGDCDSSSQYGIWTYTPSGDDDDDKGEDGPKWQQHAANLLSDDDALTHPGPTFLGASVSFSSEIEPSVSGPILYSFGGMCASPRDDITSWQSAGRYTNVVRKAVPSDSGGYELSSVPGKGPVRGAGFTLSRLRPSLDRSGDTVTQSTSYVLLGGHTQDAFINMSTAAVWNLPEETWSFTTIGAPRAKVDGELRASAAEAAALVRRSGGRAVDSRSGHTAVLSEDGSRLVLLGGWVGNVDRAAQPQLITLEMGASQDEWQWAVPDEQPEGSGLYGHGAALLPGNVMMVLGGHKIGGSSTWRLFRRQAQSDGPRFLNLTSMKWSSSYISPLYGSSGGSKTAPDGSGRGQAGEVDEKGAAGESGEDEERAKRLGLGIGLGVGLPLIIAAIVLYFFLGRFARRKRVMRDDAIRALAQDRARFLQGESESEVAERDYDSPYDAFSWGHSAWRSPGSMAYDDGARSLGYETLRGSRNHLPPTPSPAALQVPRKQPAAWTTPSRGAYQPTGASVPPGIHPIYEADEESEQFAYGGGGGAGAPADATPEPLTTPMTPTSQRYSDPFANPLSPAAPVLYPAGRSTATPSPEGPRMDPEVQDWMSDVDAVEGLLARRGRQQGGGKAPSPGKSASTARTAPFAAEDDARTGSNLSESAHSAFSAITRSTSGRSHHLRTGFGLLAGGSAAADGQPGSSSSSSPSYNTAKSSFTILQSEGPQLLLGGGEVEHYDTNNNNDSHHHHRRRPEEDEDEDFVPMPGSPSKMKPRRGWLGSLRRVFAAPAPAAYEVADGSPTRHSFEYGPADYERQPHPLTSIGGGSLLRRKQGKHAWEDELPALPSDHHPATGVSRGLGVAEAQPRRSGETDWDIERAVEQRLVQVMFTVPREKLRVVNGEVDGDDLSFVEGRRSPGGRGSPPAEAREVGSPSAGEEGLTLPDLAPLPALDDVFARRTPSRLSAYEERRSVEMDDEDATVAPLTLSRREAPRIPETPKTPETPVTPETPEAPEMPEMPEALEIPKMSAIPKISEIPEVPERSAKREDVAETDVSMDMSMDGSTVLGITPSRPMTKVLQMVQSFEGLNREASPVRQDV